MSASGLLDVEFICRDIIDIDQNQVPETRATKALIKLLSSTSSARDRVICSRCDGHHKSENCVQWKDRKGNWLKGKSPAEPPPHVRLRRDAEILHRDKAAVANKAVSQLLSIRKFFILY